MNYSDSQKQNVVQCGIMYAFVTVVCAIAIAWCVDITQASENSFSPSQSLPYQFKPLIENEVTNTPSSINAHTAKPTLVAEEQKNSAPHPLVWNHPEQP